MKKPLLFLVFTMISIVTAFASGHTVAITSSNNATCNGTCNGSATATVTGGVGPFTYSWSPSGGTAALATSLCAGNYTVTCTDNSDMSTATATVNITEPTAVTNAIAPMGVPCAGMCMPMTSSVSGGTPPYTYSWSPSYLLSASNIANPTACLAYSTTFTLVTTDAYGCSFASSNTMVVPPPVMVTVSSTPTPCGVCNGTATATVTGGYPPYTYSWVGPGSFYSTVANPTGLCGGTYGVTVSSSGCTGTYYAVGVANTGGPTVVLDSVQDINCAGAAFGTISVHATGGTGVYTYVWTPGGQTGATATNLVPGTYVVTVADGSGCTSSESYTVHNTSSLYPYITSNYANCSANGSAVASGIGGVPPYTFLWNDPLHQTTPTISGLGRGAYTVVITDAAGCDISGSIYIDSFCSNVVKGRVYRDVNSNCVQDSGEPGLAGVSVYGGTTGYTDALGDYTLYTTNMSPTISTNYVSAYTHPTCPPTGMIGVNFTTLGDTAVADFGYYQDTTVQDLVIHPGWTSATPGYQKTYWICYYNNSPLPKNAVITFVYDSALQFVSATMGGIHYPAQHKIVWTYTAIPHNIGWDWAARPVITFNVPATVSITDSLQSYFDIQPIAGDVAPADNTLTANEPVTGSHDPNSKSVMPKGFGVNGNISPADSVLMYTIHFQNNGNDTAHTVIVTDELSPYLDPATVVPGAGDHPFTYSIGFNNVMTFTFNNIMLPDSTSEEPASNGYFNYTVKLRPGLPMGTVIQNTANIYFDFNSAVVTNTTINTLADVATGIATTSTNNEVKVFPNPFTDNTTFVIQSDKLNESYSFQLTDVLGKTVRSMTGISEKQFILSRSGLENGVYFYKIYTANKNIGIGKLIIE